MGSHYWNDMYGPLFCCNFGSVHSFWCVVQFMPGLDRGRLDF